MCGRFTMATPGQVIAEVFGLDEVPELAPRFNIAPTQAVAAVRARADGGRELVALTWGLIPSWSKDRAIGSRMINARAETVGEKPAFRAALRARRCLVLADGFYEWQKLGTRKQPHHIRMRDGRPFAFAGLWERWTPPDGDPVESCTIITTVPNEVVAPIHDRMPVILAPADLDRWLDPGTRDPATVAALLRPYPGRDMTAYPVSLRVNSPGADDPSCVVPLNAA
ncbi:MAG: SOS response-associated peptidase [Acidobacteria bacterium]|nr:SOS response-associated peptidase [Acidobacteriota bacterium]